MIYVIVGFLISIIIGIMAGIRSIGCVHTYEYKGLHVTPFSTNVLLHEHKCKKCGKEIIVPDKF